MSWADELTEEERSKFDAWQQKRQPNVSYSDMLAEFGSYYGWQAVRDVLEDGVSARLFLDLLMSGRELQRKRDLNRMIDVYNAIAATQSKQAFNNFKRMTKQQ